MRCHFDNKHIEIPYLVSMPNNLPALGCSSAYSSAEVEQTGGLCIEQTFGTFYIVKYLAVCLAILFWLHHVYMRQTLSRYEKMKELKQWHNLPILLTTQSNEETLDSMIDAECDKLSTSHSLSVLVSLIAAAIFLLPL